MLVEDDGDDGDVHQLVVVCVFLSLCLHQIALWCVVNGLHPRSTSRQWKYEEIVWALKSCACASRDSSSAIVVSYLKVHFAMVAFKSRRGWYNA